MAGSYRHVVTRNGNLKSNEALIESLETGGDVFETVEELYGMVWFLAWQSAAPGLGLTEFKNLQYAREMVKHMVEAARRHHTLGLQASREIHRLSPDRGRN